MNQIRAENNNDKKLFFENRKRLLSYKEAALYLGISGAYLRKLKAKGRLKSVSVGFGARPGVRFDISDLQKWIEERKL